MGKVLIIGAGGVGTVVVHKVAQNTDVLNQNATILQKQSKNAMELLFKLHK